MNKKTLFISMITFLVLAAAGVGLWQSQGATASGEEPLEATGVIEARTVRLAPEVGGQVVEVLVEEGQRVTAGQALLQLEDAMLIARRAQAQAALEAAEANLALLKAGATTEQIVAGRAQLAQAEANLKIAQANRNELTAGAHPQDVAATQTSLDLAWERYENLRVGLTFDQLEAVRIALQTAKQNLAVALAHRDDHIAQDPRHADNVFQVFSDFVLDAEAAIASAQRAYETTRNASLPYVRQLEVVHGNWELAQSNVTQAQAYYRGLEADQRTMVEAIDAAQAVLDSVQEVEAAAQYAYDQLNSGTAALQLEAVWNDVQRLQAQLRSYAMDSGSASAAEMPSVTTLLAQIDAATDQREMAEANLNALLNGARAEELAAAKAQVDAAQAQLDALAVQLEKYTISAPWDGIVLTRSTEPGATVLPGGTVLEIGRLDRLELTVYLPEDEFGSVMPGQEARVRVDTYRNRIFSGVVLRVADEAEFTPTNIQTKDDRVRLVYAVTVSLENEDLALKPGMIADATFGE